MTLCVCSDMLTSMLRWQGVQSTATDVWMSAARRTCLSQR